MANEQQANETNPRENRGGNHGIHIRLLRRRRLHEHRDGVGEGEAGDGDPRDDEEQPHEGAVVQRQAAHQKQDDTQRRDEAGRSHRVETLPVLHVVPGPPHVVHRVAVVRGPR